MSTPSLESLFCSVLADVIYTKGGREAMNVMFVDGIDLKPVVNMIDTPSGKLIAFSAKGHRLPGGAPNYRPAPKIIHGTFGRLGGAALHEFLQSCLKTTYALMRNHFTFDVKPMHHLSQGRFTVFEAKFPMNKPSTHESFCMLFHRPYKSKLIAQEPKCDWVKLMSNQITSTGNLHKRGTDQALFLNPKLLRAAVSMHNHDKVDMHPYELINDIETACVNAVALAWVDPQEIIGLPVVGVESPDPEPAITNEHVDEGIWDKFPSFARAAGRIEDQKKGEFEVADGEVYDQVLDIVGARFVANAKMYVDLTSLADRESVSSELKRMLLDEAQTHVNFWADVLNVSYPEATEMFVKFVKGS